MTTISVLMPTHNAARTVGTALESVFRQTVAPHEILVLDDGSTDDTVAALAAHEPRIRLITQENRGVAYTRNRLCAEATGDLLAFLDHDDVWHPTYLEVQQSHFAVHPDVVAHFTGHTHFFGYTGGYQWEDAPLDVAPVELIDPADYVMRYNRDGTFGCPSFMCIPKSVVGRLNDEPFKVDAAEDAYFCTWLPLLGTVGYCPTPLVAYRYTEGATSTDQVRAVNARLKVLSLMEPEYRRLGSSTQQALFASVFAAKRRQYAKHLLGDGRRAEARGQLRQSLGHSHQAASVAKSLGLLAASYMPPRLQPTWPSAHREWRDASASAQPPGVG
jgi:Glycosyl transferase family 2